MDSNEYRKKCEWLAAFYKEAAETGRLVQQSCMTAMSGPNLNSNPQDWRLKPEPDKAWLVWYPSSSVPQMFLDAAAADHYASRTNGTIQEITRPEPK